VNLTKQVQNARMGDAEVVELLKVANGYLPRVRLEYDRVIEELNPTRAELNSWKAAVSNEVRVYQQFVNRNVELKRREDELQLSINGLEAKKTKLNKSLSEFQYNINLDPDVEQGDVILTNDVLIPPHVAINYPSKVEPSSRTLIFDTKDLF
jgi:hypothetical protein